jgi:hypothetical protein
MIDNIPKKTSFRPFVLSAALSLTRVNGLPDLTSRASSATDQDSSGHSASFIVQGTERNLNGPPIAAKQ